MSDKISQNKKVLAFMKLHNSITSMDAINNFKCTRLSAIIDNLKKQGHLIDNLNKSGYAKYVLIKEAANG